ncbi:OmpW family protein [Thalassobaculum sp. OXR-137]|uniref:OmpW/AlkL family protein n=1 Tax=Thalassobaculum sp. OXR-137 TaxID=3100173 RepID=UPI002AC91408|nr:OmpW family protein [Thalassobaculum sp. OXR-137]WPZ33534.1 OmpW family protein [Thalassobaculum sp. OXR-137]
MSISGKLTVMAATAAVVGALTVAGGSAQAQSFDEFKPKSAGDFVIRARGIAMVPDESTSTSDIATGEGELTNDYVPEVDFSYFITDNIAVELIAATTKHDLTWNNPDVDLGSVWLLPPTLTVQYHFMPKERFSPYIGAGLNYTLFYNEKSGAAQSISYDNSIGYALQAGFDYAISGPWSLNVDVKKVFLDTKVTADLGAGPVKVDADLNPWVFGVGVGYRF